MSGIWVALEERNGKIGRISWEAVAAGLKLGAQLGLPVSAVLPGAQTEALAAEAATKGVAKVVRMEHALLGAYTADAFTIAFQQFIAAEKPDYLIFPHSYQVRDYAPALAARLGQVLIGDVTAIGDGPVFLRQLMQGRLSGEYRHAGGGTCFVSVQSGAFRADQTQAGAAATVETFSPTIDAAQIHAANAFIEAFFTNEEDSYLQYRAGLLHGSSWESDVATIRQTLMIPAWRVGWKMCRHRASEEYRAYIDSLLLEVKPVKAFDEAAVWKSLMVKELAAT